MHEPITERRFAMLLILTMLGGATTLGGVSVAGRDSWLAALLAAVLALPLFALFRSLSREVDAQPFAVFDAALGKPAGRFFCLVYALVAVHVGALTLSAFTFFARSVTLHSTPQVVLAALMTLTVLAAARRGVGHIAVAAGVFLPIVTVMSVLAFVSVLPQSEFRQILPVAASGLQSMAGGTFGSLMLHFSEGFFVFFAAAPYITKRGTARGGRAAVWYTGLFLVISLAENMMSLTYPLIESFVFPHFAAVSLVSVGPFFQRLELLLAAAFLLCEIVKAAICLIFAWQATHHAIPSLRETAVTPIAFGMMALSLIVFDSVGELLEWREVYAVYLTPFLLVLPVLIWVVLRVKNAWAARRPGGRAQSA